MTVDTSKDNGTRGDGIPCGYHPGYSYNCADCKHYPDADPNDIEDYRNYYPDPDKQPWTAEPEETPRQAVIRLRKEAFMKLTEADLIEESIQKGTTWTESNDESAPAAHRTN